MNAATKRTTPAKATQIKVPQIAERMRPTTITPAPVKSMEAGVGPLRESPNAATARDATGAFF